MKNTIYQSFSEVNDIINHMEGSIKQKIPDELKKIIQEKMDKNYIVNIDYSKKLNEQNLLNETRAILSLLYRDYLCDKDEKERLLKIDKEELEKQRKELQDKYNINFEKRKSKIESNTDVIEEKDMIVAKEEKIFQRIWNKIKKLLIKS